MGYAVYRGRSLLVVFRRDEQCQTDGTAAETGDERRRVRFYRGGRAAFARRSAVADLARLKFRRKTASSRLDVSRTVERAAETHGLVTQLIYGKHSLTVSHLVLIGIDLESTNIVNGRSFFHGNAGKWCQDD